MPRLSEVQSWRLKDWLDIVGILLAAIPTFTKGVRYAMQYVSSAWFWTFAVGAGVLVANRIVEAWKFRTEVRKKLADLPTRQELEEERNARLRAQRILREHLHINVPLE